MDVAHCRAHHVGLDVTPVLGAPGVAPSSWFGLVDYEAAGPAPDDTIRIHYQVSKAGGGYLADGGGPIPQGRVLRLKALFANDAISAFGGLVAGGADCPAAPSPVAGRERDCYGAPMAATDPFVPEIAYVETPRIACDGASATHPALGHPRIYLQIDEKGFVDCGYCDKRFVLKGGPADTGGAAA